MDSKIQCLGEAFYSAVLDAWQADGPVIIERVWRENPVVYLKLIASLLPRQIAADAEPIALCTDHDLETLRGILVRMKDWETEAES